MDYLSKNHTKFLIAYHLIFVCKYRKKLWIPYGKVVKSLFEEMGARSDFSFALLVMPVRRPFVTTLPTKAKSQRFIHEAEDLVVFSPSFYKEGVLLKPHAKDNETSCHETHSKNSQSSCH